MITMFPPRFDKKLGLLNSGAAPMPVELIDKAQDMGIYFSEGWGMSETTSLGIANPILGLKKVGWLYSGDIAVQDEDDYFAIVDRKKDMIIAGGYNIYPREIDEVLYQHPKIADAVSVGIADEYRGETVKAYVVIKEGESATEAEIVDFCKKKSLRPTKLLNWLNSAMSCPSPQLVRF